jgi:hypothetical protein
LSPSTPSPTTAGVNPGGSEVWPLPAGKPRRNPDALPKLYNSRGFLKDLQTGRWMLVPCTSPYPHAAYRGVKLTSSLRVQAHGDWCCYLLRNRTRASYFCPGYAEPIQILPLPAVPAARWNVPQGLGRLRLCHLPRHLLVFVRCSQSSRMAACRVWSADITACDRRSPSTSCVPWQSRWVSRVKRLCVLLSVRSGLCLVGGGGADCRGIRRVLLFHHLGLRHLCHEGPTYLVYVSLIESMGQRVLTRRVQD